MKARLALAFASFAFLPNLTAAQELSRADARQMASLSTARPVMEETIRPVLTPELIVTYALKRLDHKIQTCIDTAQSSDDAESCDAFADAEVPMDFNTQELAFDFAQIDHEPQRLESLGKTARLSGIQELATHGEAKP